jgi:hypothetical protein
MEEYKTPVDIKTLIHTSSIEIYDKNRLINKLQQHFTDEEQQLYVCNLFLYLNYNPVTDFIINLDNVWKFIGFSNKANAKRLLKHNFKEGTDYNKGGNTVIRLDDGKFSNETIMLNINTFKKLCLKANTENADKIHDYYIKLEIIYNELMKEEIEEKKRQIEQQKSIQEETKKQLEDKEKQLESLKKLKTRKWYNQEPGDTVYAIKVNNIIKIGKTKDIRHREGYYTQNQIDDMFYIKKCYNCDLTEKVIHHILDKYREENNKEWFNISNELAIYTMNIVCNFLDNFIECSEKLPISNLKEYINSSYDIINPNKEDKEDNEENENSMLNKIVKIECNEDKMKKFIEEFCELGDNYSVLSYELYGAYRIWSKGMTNVDRSRFAQFMRKNYKSKRKYYKEYNESSLLTYHGIKPKDLILVQEDKSILPKYEEFILSECKYNYNYRIGYTNFIDTYLEWCSKKYPGYTMSKQEQFNMNSYINRHFLKDKINMPGYRNVNGIWGFQLKSENTIQLGINPTKRREIIKIEYKTRKITEEFKSVIIASNKLKLNASTIRNYIRDKRVINNEFILEYKTNINNNITEGSQNLGTKSLKSNINDSNNKS